jgi:hypothetical protein
MRILTGSLYFLRPVGQDAQDFRIVYWKDYIVRVIQPNASPINSTTGFFCVETRQGDLTGLVLTASLQPLDRKTRNVLRRERRRSAHLCN